MDATLSLAMSSKGAVLRPFLNRPTGGHVQACRLLLRSRTVRDVSTLQASTLSAGWQCAGRIEHGQAGGMPERFILAGSLQAVRPIGRAAKSKVRTGVASGRRTANIAQGAKQGEGTEQRKPKQGETTSESTFGRPDGIEGAVIPQFSQHVCTPGLAGGRALEVGRGDANAMAGVS